MPQGEEKRTIGYIVSTWPSLSQTFVLNEILALERLGVPIRIYSMKDPKDEPVHADVSQVKAKIVYLSWRRGWKFVVVANLRLAVGLPTRYLRILLEALGYHRWGIVRRFFQAAYLANMLRRDQVVHLHAHFATAPTLIAMFTHELLGIPYTFTAHARDIYVDTQAKLLRAQMQRAEAVITISEYNRRYLSTQLGLALNGRVRCVYNGLDLRQFEYCPLPASGGPLLLLSVGRLIEKKGFGNLLASARILRERGHNFKLEIIGNGPLRKSLEDQAKRAGLADVVSFLGAQPQEEVRLAFKRAAIFVLPCVIAFDGDRDGIPTVLLEAMAVGTPVVSTSVSGIPELINSGRNGLLVKPKDPRLLADAIEQLLASPQLRKDLSLAGRESIEERFAIDRNCRQLLSLFNYEDQREKALPLHVSQSQWISGELS